MDFMDLAIYSGAHGNRPRSAIAAQPASAAILGISAPLQGQALVVFAPVLLVAVPIVLIVIGNGAIQQVKRVLSGEGQKYSQNEN